MDQKELAKMIGVSQPMVSRHVRMGMPTTDLAAAERWRAENLSPSRTKAARLDPDTATPSAAPGPPPARTQATKADAPTESHIQARTRRETAEADLAELRRGEERGELFRIDAVKAALSVAFATAREALLQIPARIAPLLAADTDPANVQNVLYGEIHQALAHLSGASERLGQPTQEIHQ